MKQTTPTPNREWVPYVKAALAIAGTIFLIVGIVTSFYTIGAGQRGVLMTFGEPSFDSKEPGLHMKIPFGIQKVAKLSVQTQKYEVPAAAASKDLQTVTSVIALNYHLSPELVPIIYVNSSMAFQERIISPEVQEAVKAATAKYTAEELITQRDVVKLTIQDSLQSRLNDVGLVVESLNIVDFDFSESFNTAIEQKVTAEQLKLKAERDLERIKIEAQQIEAQAIGQKNAKIAQAEGDAQAIALIDEQLSRSPTYIEYLATQRWNGILPTVTGGAMPFVDVSTYATG